MKYLIPALLLLMKVPGFSQAVFQPRNNLVEYKRIANEETKMTWFLLQDTTRIEIGTVDNTITTDSAHVTLVSKVKMRESPVAWTDTSIAERNTLKPVYQASCNGQRYINVTLYPTLIRWLPLRTGFTRDLAIDHYDPAGKKSIRKASIIMVRQCDYLASDDLVRKVWMVIVKDDKGPGTNTYFIDVDSRKLWKMIIASGETKMLLEAA